MRYMYLCTGPVNLHGWPAASVQGSYCTENIRVMHCGVLNWSSRKGWHTVHFHVQHVCKHRVRHLRYDLYDDFSHTKWHLLFYSRMVEQIFTKLPPRVRMGMKNNHKKFQLDRIHRDRENMKFSCVKFDILMFMWVCTHVSYVRMCTRVDY